MQPTVHGGADFLFISCGQVGTIPSLTGALRGQAQPSIFFLTWKGLLVLPNFWKLDGILI